MKNAEISKIFYEISDYLAMDDVPFKPRAYERAAQVLASLDEDVADIYKRGGKKALDKIPAIGASMAEIIEEYVKTGKIAYYETLKKKMPVQVSELTAIEGVGPKMVRDLYKYLKVKTLADLERAARAGKISRVPHFRKKTEANILKGIEFLKKSKGRRLLSEVLPLACELEKRLCKAPGVMHAHVAGSIRRRQETIGDFDFVATGKDPRKISDFFISMPEVIHVYDEGPSLVSVRLHNGMDADLRIVDDRYYGAALHHFTGDTYHNIEMRKLAIAKGMKLSEYGVMKGKKTLATKTEEDVFRALGLSYIEPEMRTASGEIDLARRKKLPKLVQYGDIRGDLQIHTSWTDGGKSIREMARVAKKMGYEYIAITDHWRATPFGGTLDPKNYKKYIAEIRAAETSVGIKIFAGTEVDILEDGTLAAEEKHLRAFDIVLAGVHSHFHLSRAVQTARLERAMQNPFVDIIVHPTGRVLKRRDEYEIDRQKIYAAAKASKTFLEIDAYPDRLDLRDIYIREAIAAGVMLAIDTDAHAPEHLKNMELGIAQARRGWAEKKNIANTRKYREFFKMLKKGKK